MNAEYIKKLALPEQVKEMYPVTPEMDKAVAKTKREIEQVIEGLSDKLVLIIGPCSADNEDSVVDYISRLCPIQEKVQDKIMWYVSPSESHIAFLKLIFFWVSL